VLARLLSTLLLVLSAGAVGFSGSVVPLLVLTWFSALVFTRGGGGADISGLSDFAGLGAMISIAELLGAVIEILA
jgi:hypothetical protein